MALPDEAKNFQVDVSVKNCMGETVLDYHEQTRSMVESHDFVIENENMLHVKHPKSQKICYERHESSGLHCEN